MNATIRRLEARAAGRTGTGRPQDAGVAILAALMTIMILAALSVLVLGVVMSQVKTTHFAEKNTRTIFAAEAGVETTLGKIRTAVGGADFTGKIYGDSKQLPCSLSGTVDTTGSGTTYTVEVQYFTDNPAGQTPTWRNGHKLSCTNGVGPSTLPSYAYITSKGQAVSSAQIASTTADRGISMIYQFQTTTTNVKGGRIWSWSGGSSQWCLRADGLVDGSTVSYQPAATCGSTLNDNTELWIYDTDYTLTLASSTLTGTKLCLTNMTGNAIQLKTCTTPTYKQLWSWHSGGRATWQAQDSGTNDNGYCLSSQSTSGNPTNGDKVKVSNPCADQQAWGSFSPDPAVGPGAASVNTHQIVNYLEFGRCFDVTDTQVGKMFMIAYPCKQDPPAAADLYWNHRWYYEEPLVGTVGAAQLIYVKTTDGNDYCLQTPSAATNPNDQGVTSGWYPTLNADCNINNPAQRWVRSMGTGDKTTSWTLRDVNGKCISAAGPKYKGNWTSLIVAACDGTTAQKWNAPAANVPASVGNYLEETG